MSDLASGRTPRSDPEELPGPRSVLDVKVPGRDDLLVSVVTDGQPGGGELVVGVAQDRTGRRIRVPVGEQVEIVWRDRGGLLARDARLLEVVPGGPEPTWRLRPVGRTRSGQRRAAVRAQVGLPVTLSAGPRSVLGTSLDLSEVGLRGRWPTNGGWPALQERVTVTVQLGEGRTVSGPAEVRRGYPVTDGRLEASLVFLDWPERVQDQVRTRVFERLRELARRGDR